MFVAVTCDSNKTAWSDDGGKTWNAGAALPYSSAGGIAYGNGVFVAIGYNLSGNSYYPYDFYAVWSNDDGKTWDLSNGINAANRGKLPANPTSGTIESVTYGNGVFMAVGWDEATPSGGTPRGPIVNYSSGGKSWGRHTSGPGYAEFTRVAFGIERWGITKRRTCRLPPPGKT